MNTMSERDSEIAAIITRLIRGFIAKPVTVDVFDQSREITIVVMSHIDDYGNLIGKDGANFKSVEMIAVALGRAFGGWVSDGIHAEQESFAVRYIVPQPDGKESKNKPKFVTATKWDAEPFRKLLEDLLSFIVGDKVPILTINTGNITTLQICKRDSRIEHLLSALNTIWKAMAKANGRSEMLVRIL